jgi:hypothetical protein
VLDVLTNLDDARTYRRGSIAAMGFDQIGVGYERDARRSGESVLAFGDMLAVSALSLLSLVGYVVARFVSCWDWPAGFATTTALILVGIGLTALCLGIAGEYRGRIYPQVKRSPNAIVERTTETVAMDDGARPLR